jgi:very-short-patch-repair endonuclease
MQQSGFHTARARQLRDALTPAERILWAQLRNRRLKGLKFRRQVPLGPFVADFYCADLRLVVEADGSQHANCPSDKARDAWMVRRGFTVLRFWNNDISCNLPGVLSRIAEHSE